MENFIFEQFKHKEVQIIAIYVFIMLLGNIIGGYIFNVLMGFILILVFIGLKVTFKFKEKQAYVTAKIFVRYFGYALILNLTIIATIKRFSKGDNIVDIYMGFLDDGWHVSKYLGIISIAVFFTIYVWYKNKELWQAAEDSRIKSAVMNYCNYEKNSTKYYYAQEFIELFSKIDEKTLEVNIKKKDLPYNMKNYFATSFFELKSYQNIENMPSESMIMFVCSSRSKYDEMKKIISNSTICTSEKNVLKYEAKAGVMSKSNQSKISKKVIYILLAIFILFIFFTDYFTGLILNNYTNYDYQISYVAFVLIIVCFTIILFILPLDLNFFGSEESNTELDYFETGYDDYLKKLLLSEEFKSIFINGPFGCGKTTMLEHVLDNMHIKKDKYIKLNLYGATIENNIDFIYSQLRDREPKTIQFFRNTMTYTVTSFLAFCAILISAVYTKNPNIKVFPLIAVAYVLSSAYIQYIKTPIYKDKYILKKFRSLDFVIVDDLDRAYNNETSIISLIHTISNFINLSNGTKLILLGNRYSFLEDSKSENSAPIHILEKYYDFDFEFPIDIVRDQHINSLMEALPEVKYNLEQFSDIRGLLKNCSTRNILKIQKSIHYNLREEPIILKKLFLTDYLFIETLYAKNLVNVDDFLTKVNKEVSMYRFESNFEEVQKKFENCIKGFQFSKNEKSYLYDALKYQFQDVGTGLIRLGAHKYDNRLFNFPQYYKRSSYISGDTSPAERIDNFIDNLDNNPQAIGPMDVYFYTSSSIEEEEKNVVMSKVLVMAEQENSYSSNLSNAVKYIIAEDDERVGLNLKYNWVSSNGLADKKAYSDICNLITDDNFDKLSLANKINLLEREYYNNDNRYFKLIPKGEYINYVNSFIKLERPWNVFKIFDEKIDNLKEEDVEQILYQYKDKLEEIKTNYNYYADNPFSGKRKDEDDPELKAYNEIKAFANNTYGINEEKFQFSFED